MPVADTAKLRQFGNGSQRAFHGSTLADVPVLPAGHLAHRLRSLAGFQRLVVALISVVKYASTGAVLADLELFNSYRRRTNKLPEFCCAVAG